MVKLVKQNLNQCHCSIQKQVSEIDGKGYM